MASASGNVQRHGGNPADGHTATLPHRPIRFGEELCALIKLAYPLIFANLVQMGIYTTDVFFIGRLGTIELGAAAVTTGIYSIFIVFVSGLVTAIAPILGEAVEKPGKGEELRRALHMAIWMGGGFTILSWMFLWNIEYLLYATKQEEALIKAASSYKSTLIWSLLPATIINIMRIYFSATEQTRIVFITTFAGLIFNGVADWLLIFGYAGFPELGIAGAGLASSLTNIFMAAILIYLAQHYWKARIGTLPPPNPVGIGHGMKENIGEKGGANNLEKGANKEGVPLSSISAPYDINHREPSQPPPLFAGLWQFDAAYFMNILRLGLPIAFTFLFEVSVFGGAALVMGRISLIDVAAHAIALQIASITFMVPMGIAQAATVRVARASASGNKWRITLAGRASVLTAFLFMFLSACLISLNAEWLASIFLKEDTANSDAVIARAISFLYLAALFQITDGVQVIAQANLRGLRDTRIPMIIAAFGYLVFAMGGGSYLAFGVGLGGVGVWLGFVGALTITAILMQWRWIARDRLKLIRYD